MVRIITVLMMLKSGKLNRIVIVKSYVAPTPPNIEPTYSTGSEVWATMIPVTGREIVKGESLTPEQTMRFFLRYYSSLTITEKDLIVDADGKEYEIKYIREVGYKEGFEITALRIGNE